MKKFFFLSHTYDRVVVAVVVVVVDFSALAQLMELKNDVHVVVIEVHKCWQCLAPVGRKVIQRQRNRTLYYYCCWTQEGK